MTKNVFQKMTLLPLPPSPSLLLSPLSLQQTKYLPSWASTPVPHLDFACHSPIHFHKRYCYQPPYLRTLHELQQLGLWEAATLYQQQPKKIKITGWLWHITTTARYAITLTITKIIIQFLLHIQKKNLFLLLTPTEVTLNATSLYPNLQEIYLAPKTTLSNNFL